MCVGVNVCLDLGTNLLRPSPVVVCLLRVSTPLSIDGVHKVMVATSEGMLYVTSVEAREGGECRNPVEYRSVELCCTLLIGLCLCSCVPILQTPGCCRLFVGKVQNVWLLVVTEGLNIQHATPPPPTPPPIPLT